MEDKQNIVDSVSLEELSRQKLMGIILVRSQPFIGKKRSQIVEELNGECFLSSKQLDVMLFKRMVGLDSGLIAQNELDSCFMHIKNIALNPDGYPREHMSFPADSFQDISRESFEESKFGYSITYESFVFSVWMKNANGGKDETFIGSFLWKMPDNDVKKCAEIFYDVKRRLLSGHIFSKTSSGELVCCLPKATKDGISHMRPHGRNGHDFDFFPKKDLLTGNMSMTRQSFWLNRWYIGNVVKEVNKMNNGMIG